MKYTEILRKMIAARAITRKMIAPIYLLHMVHGRKKDTPEINHLIINRWSEAGLHYIKTIAWSELMRITNERRTYDTPRT